MNLLIFGSDHGCVGISHYAIFDDRQDNWFCSMHPNNLSQQTTAEIHTATHCVRSIHWTDSGWPLITPERYGAVPKVPINNERELIGNRQNINLTYNYANQNTSTSLTFNADYTVSGELFDGQQCSFSTSNDVLTVGSIKLDLQREVNREASPRKATIVYAGLSTNGKTTYLKKVN